MSANSSRSSSGDSESQDISLQDISPSSSSAESSNDVQLREQSPSSPPPPSFPQEYDHQGTQSPLTPSTPTFDAPLLSQLDGIGRTPSRSLSTHFVSSPLNPNAPTPPFQRSRPQSRLSMSFNRVASDESQALSSPPHVGHRGSMILYRFATQVDRRTSLLPPRTAFHHHRDVSSAHDSVLSLSHDSKYPAGSLHQRGLIPYAYDPTDEKDLEEDDDPIHDPDDSRVLPSSGFALRGFVNVGVLVVLIAGLVSLFIAYPVVSYIHDLKRSEAIIGNTLVNASGQVVVTSGFVMPTLIDPTTPQTAMTRVGFDNISYDLVFSDEFNTDNRTFWPGDDPFWEAANIWYWTTADEEWYDPGQITTKNGYLSIVMDKVPDHGLPYRSGMLQSWNKFCFTTGYIEVSISLPGPNQETMGYWPGAWTMGNLARAGYGATTDGVWPYSYDACDVGTFPNQTLPDGSGPAAALHSNASRSKYNYELSWLPGQRLSACTCPDSDHPGPSPNIGRGAPEIDILEVEHNKLGSGQVVSQSAQFAPFTHDYVFLNGTGEDWEVLTPDVTSVNSYHGSPIQQAVSALTLLPDDIFQESGAQFTTFGFEYWSDPKNPSDGYITWQTGGVPSARLGAGAMGPDMGAGGTGVGQRLISVEPMSIVLNLGISPNWQTIDLSTMLFPAEMRVDYVRVYQREGETNVGCSPAGFPTEEYIERHWDVYTNPNLTTWNYPKPKNSLYAGGC